MATGRGWEYVIMNRGECYTEYLEDETRKAFSRLAVAKLHAFRAIHADAVKYCYPKDKYYIKFFCHRRLHAENMVLYIHGERNCISAIYEDRKL